ncbi:hypothetical protein HII36_29800 [Nonomuraea sp. NN258]|uniref:hypothetical protein n=1 Tax=Nonomuraea antri TaxID=2730852 RepID=UPI0015686A0E|nr:hypothetical protein [Nonomuraea antri]NRQ35995.1 hypothetical protein [Nonomuraea antri]
MALNATMPVYMRIGTGLERQVGTITIPLITAGSPDEFGASPAILDLDALNRQTAAMLRAAADELENTENGSASP